MKQVVAKVISNREVLPEFTRGSRAILGTWLIQMDCRDFEPVRPGQFVMVCCEDCTLPRPFSVHQSDGKSIALLYTVLAEGKGTRWLSLRQKGDNVRLFGPLGKSFSILPTSKNLLLLAGGNGVAPMYFLVNTSTTGYNVTLFYGTANKNRYPLDTLPTTINQVEVTEDGSVGRRGLVTDFLPEYTDWADQVFACGPLPMYRAMAENPKLKGKPVQVSLEVRMGCGVGVCYGCTVRTRQGLKQVCQDGPVFELGDILWESVVC